MTAVFTKLNYKGQDPILVLAAPDTFEGELRAMTSEAKVHRTLQPGTRYGFALAFAPMKADLLKAAQGVLSAIEDGAVVWFAYPKQTSKRYTSDLNRDLCWETLKPLSLQPVRQIAIDDDWSALRFKTGS
jgi:hypothetical protein